MRLEALPNAIFFGRDEEVEILRTFFEGVARWVPSSPELSARAFELTCHYGLGAVDALHVAAAEAEGAELVTAEKPTKPMLRVVSLQVTSIRAGNGGSGS